MPRLPHTSKPDRDNLDKAVMDALKGIAWIDDGDEQPHVLLELGPAIL
jgi:Holliday junction resolvase RusA-like endonuclease